MWEEIKTCPEWLWHCVPIKRKCVSRKLSIVAVRRSKGKILFLCSCISSTLMRHLEVCRSRQVSELISKSSQAWESGVADLEDFSWSVLLKHCYCISLCKPYGRAATHHHPHPTSPLFPTPMISVAFSLLCRLSKITGTPMAAEVATWQRLLWVGRIWCILLEVVVNLILINHI